MATGNTKPEAKLTFPLLLAPYDIRRAIYDVLYPTNLTLELTYQSARCCTFDTGHEVFRLSQEGAGLLRSCHQVNAEITRFFYGANDFVLFPAHSAYDRVEASAQMVGDPVMELRVSTKQLVRNLYVCIGYLSPAQSRCLAEALIGFSELIVLTKILSDCDLPLPLGDTAYWARKGKIYRAIAEARAALEKRATLWDHRGSHSITAQLNEIMPDGYCSIEGSAEAVKKGFESSARLWEMKRVLRRERSWSQEL